MSNEMTGDAPKRNICLRFLAWLWGDSLGRRALFLLGALAVMVMVAYAEEDWRGAREWRKYQAEAAVRGLSLEYKSYIPKPIPYSDNFAAAAFVAGFTQPNQLRMAEDLYSEANGRIDDTPRKGERGRRHFTDLVAWQQAAEALQTGPLSRDQRFSSRTTDQAARAAAAVVVLKGLEPNAGAYEAVREASRRPLAQFAVNYNVDNPWLTLLPHLAKVKQMAQRFSLRACAELAAGQTDEAASDVKCAFVLADSTKGEPTLISYLVRIASVQLGVQPVWEGLAEHRWTEPQLQEMQTRFLSYNFVADMDLPLNAERAMGTYTADFLRKHGLGELNGLIGSSSPSPGPDLITLVGRLIPDGWYDFEKVNYNRFFDLMLNGASDPKAKTVSPSRTMNNAGELTGAISAGGRGVNLLTNHRVLAALLLPALGNTVQKVAQAQVVAEEAGLACALERYRLANGQYPETLEALAPKYIDSLPHDVITGEPYHYRRTENGSFVLYSVGWNGRDDGGVPGEKLLDTEKGDWVWEYPAK